jgi:hypothetical protein
MMHRLGAQAVIGPDGPGSRPVARRRACQTRDGKLKLRIHPSRINLNGLFISSFIIMMILLLSPWPGRAGPAGQGAEAADSVPGGRDSLAARLYPFSIKYHGYHDILI